jgi:hypothetical protein
VNYYVEAETDREIADARVDDVACRTPTTATTLGGGGSRATATA